MTRDEIIAALRYQIITPRVTTMGNCARACGGWARGSAVCPGCLTASLAEFIGITEAVKIAAAFRHEAEANWAREDEA